MTEAIDGCKRLYRKRIPHLLQVMTAIKPLSVGILGTFTFASTIPSCSCTFASIIQSCSFTFARVIPSCSFTFARVIPTTLTFFIKTFLLYFQYYITYIIMIIITYITLILWFCITMQCTEMMETEVGGICSTAERQQSGAS